MEYKLISAKRDLNNYDILNLEYTKTLEYPLKFIFIDLGLVNSLKLDSNWCNQSNQNCIQCKEFFPYIDSQINFKCWKCKNGF